jgi:hypothetical protein
MIAAMIREIRRPSTLPPDALHGAYDRAVVGIAHGIVGAALIWPLAALVGSVGMVLAIALRWAVALVYWLWKERGDLRRGGTLLDGLEDTGMVWLGTFYGPHWWPVAMLACGFWLMWRGAHDNL